MFSLDNVYNVFFKNISNLNKNSSLKTNFTLRVSILYTHIHTYICVCVCVYIYIRVVQKVLSLTQILDLSHTSHYSIGLMCIEIKTEIWISFFNVKEMIALPQQKCSATSLLSR